MEYRALGRTGLLVSAFAFGGAHIGEVIDADRTRELVKTAWDVGITAFYTADDYNNGRSEEILGRILSGRRDDVVLLVKAGYRVGTDAAPVGRAEHAAHPNAAIDHDRLWRKGVAPTARGLNRKHLTQALEASLRRLQTDYIDVYSAHYWDPLTPIEETLDVLENFVRQGKVRYLACSQTAPWQLYRALWASDVQRVSRYEGLQVRLNVLERHALDDDVRAAAAAGVGVLAFGSLAGELLAGRYRADDALPSGLGYRQIYTTMYWNERTFAFLDDFRALAAELGHSMSALAQDWVLRQAAVTTLLIGPNDAEELRTQVLEASAAIDAAGRGAVDELVRRQPVDFRLYTGDAS